MGKVGTGVIALSETIRGQVCLGAWLQAKAGGGGGKMRGRLLKPKEKQTERRAGGRGASEIEGEGKRGERHIEAIGKKSKRRENNFEQALFNLPSPPSVPYSLPVSRLPPSW